MRPCCSISIYTLGMALLLLSLQHALARPMHMIESFPAAQTEMDGRNAQYFVRFDGLVDHRGSRLFITQGDRTVERLTLLGDSAPEVLFASAPRLAPGEYELHWSAKSPCRTAISARDRSASRSGADSCVFDRSGLQRPWCRSRSCLYPHFTWAYKGLIRLENFNNLREL